MCKASIYVLVISCSPPWDMRLPQNICKKCLNFYAKIIFFGLFSDMLRFRKMCSYPTSFQFVPYNSILFHRMYLKMPLHYFVFALTWLGLCAHLQTCYICTLGYMPLAPKLSTICLFQTSTLNFCANLDTILLLL